MKTIESKEVAKEVRCKGKSKPLHKQNLTLQDNIELIFITNVSLNRAKIYDFYGLMHILKYFIED